LIAGIDMHFDMCVPDNVSLKFLDTTTLSEANKRRSVELKASALLVVIRRRARS
jgi:hypothetical protein